MSRMRRIVLYVIVGILFLDNSFGQTELNSDAKYNYELISILDSIHTNDQKYREKMDEIAQEYGLQSKEMKEIWAKTSEMDSINLSKVKEIINEFGWLGPDIIGDQGNKTLFLVIQHSDIQTQSAYLPILREAVKNNNAKAAHLALLEDRVALAQKGKQIYGSQIGQNDETGEFYIFPIEDPDNVDKRRTEVGLEPISNYLKNWNLEWDLLKQKE
ncbi:hypothetical protein MASR2M47_14180 [Draconibacterium sp.]